MEKKITKIVITGGPCAGKTTGMSWIQNFFTKKGYKVLFVSEAATELFDGGVQAGCFSNLTFQTAIMRLQLAKEEIFEKTAKESDYEKVLIVCDRGTIDGKAFSENDVFNQIVNKIGKSELELKNNYDGVFHMLTAAKGAEAFYTLENNAARKETPAQAIEADDKLINAWMDHPHFKIIGNEGDFEYKMKNLISEISQLLGEPKPFDTKKKFLIEFPNLTTLEAIENVKKIEIYQTYLICDDNEKTQIKKCEIDNDCIYYQTKAIIKNNQIIEIEKRLTEKEYEEKILSADITRKQLHRTRYCLASKNNYMEIDLYPFWDDKAILKVDLHNEDDKFEIPSFIRVIEDITNNNKYLNSELSKK